MRSSRCSIATGRSDATPASRDGTSDQSGSPAAQLKAGSANPTRSTTVEVDALALRHETSRLGAPLQYGEWRPENVGNVGNVESGPGCPISGRSEPTFLVDESSGERRNDDSCAPGVDTDEARARRELERAIASGHDVAADFAAMSLKRAVGRGRAREIEAEIRRDLAEPDR